MDVIEVERRYVMQWPTIRLEILISEQGQPFLRQPGTVDLLISRHSAADYLWTTRRILREMREWHPRAGVRLVGRRRKRKAVLTQEGSQ